MRLVAPTIIPSKDNMSRLENVKRRHRSVIIYRPHGQLTVPKVQIINRSIRAGRGPFLSNRDMVEQVVVYYGLLYGDLYTMSGKLDPAVEIGITGCDHYIRHTDLHNTMENEITTSYENLFVGEDFVPFSGRRIMVPPPEWYTDEDVVVSTDSDLKDHFSLQMRLGYYDTDGYLSTLGKLYDEHTTFMVVDNINIYTPETPWAQEYMEYLLSSVSYIHYWMTAAMLKDFVVILDLERGYVVKKMISDMNTNKSDHRDMFINLFHTIEEEMSQMRDYLHTSNVIIFLAFMDQRVVMDVQNKSNPRKKEYTNTTRETVFEYFEYL